MPKRKQDDGRDFCPNGCGTLLLKKGPFGPYCPTCWREGKQDRGEWQGSHRFDGHYRVPDEDDR